VLFSYGELLGFEDLAASIRAEFEAIDLRRLHEFEEINLAVVVAETLALIGDGAGAAAVLRRLDTLSPSQLALLRDEPMKRAYLSFVEGLVADANHDAFRARHRYRDAFLGFSAIGMTRRALLAALQLAELSRDTELHEFVEEHARALPAASWIRAKSVRLSAWKNDPLLAALTRAEREVLELLYEGKSTAEIAAGRGRSAQTIRNTVSKLLRRFSVDNRQALVKACSSRGAFAAAEPLNAAAPTSTTSSESG
jgi:DNA-binding CsgD family transcriptional regulator